MTAAASSWEIGILAWSVVLLIAQIVLQAQTATAELGYSYNLGSRDAERAPQGALARRARRALTNFLETYVAYVALALALAVTGKTGGAGALGAQIWIVARVLFVPAYLVAVPFARSILWGFSIGGLLLMIVRLLG